MKEYFRPTYAEAPQARPRSTTHAYHLSELSVYITDSCALSCSGCISFNNYALGGHLELTDAVRERISTWARLVTVDRLYIIGGEPLSHPDLASWQQLVQTLWPQSRWTIVTNGQGLASRSAEVQSWIEAGWDLEVSSHSKQDYLQALAWWQSLTQDFIEPVEHQVLRDHMGETHYWLDHAGGAVMQIGLRDQFYTPTHQVLAGEITWPKLMSARSSHRSCPAKNCTHLVDGKMYSCPVQATVPRLAERYTVSGPAGALAQQDLGYDPLAKNRQTLSTWMALLNQPKSQCSLCSWPRPLKALTDPRAKKVKLVRKVNLDSPATALEHPASPDGDEPMLEPSNQA